MIKLLPRVFCLGLLFILSHQSIAQTTSLPALFGKVIDASTGEPLKGADISVDFKKSGVTTDTLGNYRVYLPYGEWVVKVSYVGYNDQSFSDVFLTLGKTENLSLALTPDSAQLDEVVLTVNNANSVFGSDRTGAETSVGRKELTTLPTISRSASDFTRLEPTASNGSFGGRNDQFNNFSLDGAIFNNPFGLDAATPGGQTNAQPVSLDAIDQIQVSTTPYDVTQSGFTGAAVNAVTKSGTNAFKGTVYGFYRNEDMTGSKIKGQDIFVPSLKQQQTGFSIGGPIVKNKLFFFANYEQDERSDLGQAWLPNTGSGAVNESVVLESDLIAVQSALANLGYNTGTYQGFTHDSGVSRFRGAFRQPMNGVTGGT